MIYPSAEFIFLVAFLVYFFWILPSKLKPFVLLLGSLFWYSTWAAHWLLVLLALALLNYGTLIAASRRAKNRNLIFSSLLICDIGFFICVKSLPLWSPQTRMPYGISFFMLMLLGIIIDCWRSPQSERPEAVPFSTMLFFFPLLVGGPIERGKHLFPQFKKLAFNIENLSNGILVFSYGFAKRFLLGARMTEPIDHIFNLPNISPLGLFGAALLSTFQAYIDFSSYCDMGRGAALCFGVKVNFNFKPFYYAKNPNDFWQRWNISIGTWMRDYVTMPLLLRFGRKIPTAAILFFSFILIGLWHGLQWNWLCFGLFNGLLVVLFIRIQSLFRFSKPLVMSFGFLLALLLFAGNGLLQHNNAFDLLERAAHFQTSPDPAGPIAVGWQTALIALWPFALGLLIIEFFQERFNNLDFYLALPTRVKPLLAGICAMTFLALLHYGILTDYKFTLPLYFRF